MVDLDAIEAAAKAASPGPWQRSRFVDAVRYRGMPADWKAARVADEALIVRGPGGVGSPECNPVAHCDVPEDAAYIATASPDRVLALVAIARAAQRVAAPAFDGEDVDRLIAALRAAGLA